MIVNFRYHTTPELLLILRRLSARARRASHRRGLRLGADADANAAASNELERTIRTGTDMAQLAMRSVLDVASTPFGWTYGKLKEGAADLRQGAVNLRDLGFETEAKAADEFAYRVQQFGEAYGKGGGAFLREFGRGAGEGLASAGKGAGEGLASFGKGAGEGYEGFFGFTPGAALLAGLVVAGGVGYLLLSPAGQALLAGGARAIGTGGGELLAGSGRALGALGRV